jgi:hypothetical protein
MSRKAPANELGNLKRTGHGSKYDGHKEAAIAALFTPRNVEEAARCGCPLSGPFSLNGVSWAESALR